MKPTDTAALLSLAAAFDNRTVTESAARAWAEALDPRVAFDDGRRIVIEHYARESRWIMPADINAASRTMRLARLDRMRSPEPPESLDPDDVPAQLAWQRAYRGAIGDGHDEAAADRIANATLNVERPAALLSDRPVLALVEQVAKTTHVPGRGAL